MGEVEVTGECIADLSMTCYTTQEPCQSLRKVHTSVNNNGL